MKTYLTATVFIASIAMPALAETDHDALGHELMTACTAAMETAKLPEGATPADMIPNCQCLVDGSDEAERVNLIEVRAQQIAGDADAAFSEDAQEVIDTCFPEAE